MDLLWLITILVLNGAGVGCALGAHFYARTPEAERRLHSLAALFTLAAGAGQLIMGNRGLACLYLVLAMTELTRVPSSTGTSRRQELKEQRRQLAAELDETDKLAAEFGLKPVPRVDEPRRKDR